MLTRIPPVAAAAVLALALAGCTATPPGAQPSSSVSASASVLTAQGTKLALGETAKVAYSPDSTLSTTLAITVTKVTAAPMKDFELFALSATDRKSNFFYVKMTIENIGTGTVGGDPVPVWGVSPQDVLLPPVSFSAPFKPCTSKALPKKFSPGDTKDFCEVYQVKNAGELKALSYRPDASFDPIVWSPLDLANG